MHSSLSLSTACMLQEACMQSSLSLSTACMLQLQELQQEQQPQAVTLMQQLPYPLVLRHCR